MKINEKQNRNLKTKCIKFQFIYSLNHIYGTRNTKKTKTKQTEMSAIQHIQLATHSLHIIIRC